MIPIDYEYEIEEIQVGGKYGTLDGWTPVGTTKRNGKITETNSFAKENFTNNRTMAPNPAETLTVKKVWENDASSIRPKYVDMYIQSTPPSAFNLGTNSTGQLNNFTSQVQSLFGSQANMRSDMTAFKYGTKAQADAAASTRKALTLQYGESPIYLWRDGTEVYIYSDADIYFTGSMGGLFRQCEALADISGLKHIHTDFVTNLNYAFYDCISLDNSDLEALKDWNAASVTYMSYTFAGISNNKRLPLDNFSHISGWDSCSSLVSGFFLAASRFARADVPLP